MRESFVIHMILGSTLSGKSTYIENNFPNNGEHTRVFIGRWLRDAIGLDAMLRDPNPNQCDCTENWVRFHVRGAFYTRRALKNDMVFDGYPRSVGQVDWFFDCLAQDVRVYRTEPRLVVHHLVVPDAIRSLRLAARGENEFDTARFERSVKDLEAVLDRIVTTRAAYIQDFEVKVVDNA